MDKDLPDLHSQHTDKPEKRRPLLLDLLKDGVSTEVGDTSFKLNRKKAEIITQIGDAAVEMAVNRHMEARAKARMPMLGGSVEVEANRDAEGRHRFGMQARKSMFGGSLGVEANRDSDGNDRINVNFNKKF